MRATIPSAPRLTRGLLIDGRYELVRPIGSGGMSEVWSGLHRGLDRMVALKFIRADVRGLGDRLLVEAKLLSALRHPSIVEVYDLGRLADGTPFLVMELLLGVSLAEHLRARGGRLPVVDAVTIVSRVLDGLGAVHAAGVIHRDLKPENILVISGDGPPRLKIIDFGISLRGLPGAHRLTTAGSIVGTPAYLAPEQVLGATADARTDLWAVGILLYELVTGEVPFARSDLQALFRAILEEPVPYPRDIPGLDGPLFSILSEALRKEPTLRYESARQMNDALERWLAGALEQPPVPTPPAAKARDALARASTSPAITEPPAQPRRTLDALIRTRMRKT